MEAAVARANQCYKNLRTSQKFLTSSAEQQAKLQAIMDQDLKQRTRFLQNTQENSENNRELAYHESIAKQEELEQQQIQLESLQNEIKQQAKKYSMVYDEFRGWVSSENSTPVYDKEQEEVKADLESLVAKLAIWENVTGIRWNMQSAVVEGKILKAGRAVEFSIPQTKSQFDQVNELWNILSSI